MKVNKFLKAITLLAMPSLFLVQPCSCSKATKNNNPHKDAKSKDVIETLDSIRRLDKSGKLYFIENTEDYYNNRQIITTIENLEKELELKYVPGGCSAFNAVNVKDGANSSIQVGRTYDFFHAISNGEKLEYSGLNAMIHTSKDENKNIKYSSIGTIDTFLLAVDALGLENYKPGVLDDGVFDTSFMAISPYVTVDGINDQGLTASILVLPHEDSADSYWDETVGAGKIEIKKSECQYSFSLARAVRIILDNCRSVDEAETLMKSVFFNRILHQNFHVFVSDSTGKSRLFEWFKHAGTAENTEYFISVDTNAATNFYQGFTKVNDYPKLSGLKREPEYNYGYGAQSGSFDRFNAIASMLDFYTPSSALHEQGTPWNALMQAESIESLIRSVTVYPSEAGLLSLIQITQFTNIFDCTDLTQKLYSFGDFSSSYTYSLKENRFI